MPDEHPRRNGGGSLFVLTIVGFIAKFFCWIVAVLAALVLFGLLLWLAFRVARRVDAEHQAQAALVARADQQHLWILAGDDRGLYGDYPPKQIAIDAGQAAYSVGVNWLRS
jgi:hypothetical protein